MNQTFQSIRVGIFFVLGLILIYAVYSVIGDKGVTSDKGYQLTAEFENIRTITTGAAVRMAGVQIGQVTGTELENGKGRVRVAIDPAVSIPGDSVASIAMSSLLGQSYLSVQYGGSQPALADGDSLETAESADFNEILGEVQELGKKLNKMADGFSGIDGSGMGDLFTNLNDLVTENRTRFDTVMSNLEELTTKLNQSEGTLGKLINEDGLYVELMTVVEDFRAASGDMRTSLASAQGLVARVEAGEGTLGRLLVGEEIADQLEATIANMQAFSEKLNSGEGTLGKLVTDDTLYNELRGMMSKADKALDSLGDSGPITAVGAVSGALF